MNQERTGGDTPSPYGPAHAGVAYRRAPDPGWGEGDDTSVFEPIDAARAGTTREAGPEDRWAVLGEARRCRWVLMSYQEQQL